MNINKFQKSIHTDTKFATKNRFKSKSGSAIETRRSMMRSHQPSTIVTCQTRDTRIDSQTRRYRSTVAFYGKAASDTKGDEFSASNMMKNTTGVSNFNQPWSLTFNPIGMNRFSKQTKTNRARYKKEEFTVHSQVSTTLS